MIGVGQIFDNLKIQFKKHNCILAPSIINFSSKRLDNCQLFYLLGVAFYIYQLTKMIGNYSGNIPSLVKAVRGNELLYV